MFCLVPPLYFDWYLLDYNTVWGYQTYRNTSHLPENGYANCIELLETIYQNTYCQPRKPQQKCALL